MNEHTPSQLWLSYVDALQPLSISTSASVRVQYEKHFGGRLLEMTLLGFVAPSESFSLTWAAKPLQIAEDMLPALTAGVLDVLLTQYNQPITRIRITLQDFKSPHDRYSEFGLRELGRVFAREALRLTR